MEPRVHTGNAVHFRPPLLRRCRRNSSAFRRLEGAHHRAVGRGGSSAPNQRQRQGNSRGTLASPTGGRFCNGRRHGRNARAGPRTWRLVCARICISGDDHHCDHPGSDDHHCDHPGSSECRTIARSRRRRQRLDPRSLRRVICAFRTLTVTGQKVVSSLSSVRRILEFMPQMKHPWTDMSRVSPPI